MAAVGFGGDGRPAGSDLETMFEVCRKMFRIDQTHTLFGQVLSKTFNDSNFVIEALETTAKGSFTKAAQKSGLETEDFETRLDMWSHCLFGIFQGVFVTKKLTPDAADIALRVSLSIWNLSKAQAAKLTSRPIDS